MRIEPFTGVFLATIVATGMIAAALIVHQRRPGVEMQQPTAAFVEATGKCAACHRHETSAIVIQFEHSQHAAAGVTCLDCHQVIAGQQAVDHRGFTISDAVTAASCRNCHATEYEQFVRSRHGAPAWAAVTGPRDFTEEQIAFAETYHPGAVKRPAHSLVALEGPAAAVSGCQACHSIGKPNPDGSIGTCTACHSRHDSSIALARTPQTCGQCHMGPDHSQIEIYNESKHGVLFQAMRDRVNLHADPKTLTTQDQPIPTCSTCHMSGLEGLQVTHNVSERSSYWLFAAVSEKRPTYLQAREKMQAVCMKCHSQEHTDKFYLDAEAVVDSTNDKMRAAAAVMEPLYAAKLLTPEPFDEPIEFIYFDLWHYYGRTAKHGAFMGGPDFVQWHGNYEILLKTVEMKEMAKGLRAEAAGHAP